MNQIERLRAGLVRRLPGVAMELDAPADERGPWFLDVRPGCDRPTVVVEWRRGRGFGVSTPGPDDYGAGPDEVYPNVASARDRVVSLVQSGDRAGGPSYRLAELRRLLGISQSDLAAKMKTRQSNIAAMERRGGAIRVETLARAVEAMGAGLEIVARLPDGREAKLDI